MTKNIALTVKLFGQTVGYLALNTNNVVFFEYDEKFKFSHLEISPIKLSLGTTTIYTNNEDRFFEGLAGVFFDCLPDKFGNKIIKEYYEKKGIPQNQLTVLQKLAYIGSNGMGALEFIPNENDNTKIKEALEIKSLVDEARKVIQGNIDSTIPDIMEAGGSAGGARAKAIIQWNKKTNDIRSGRATLKEGYEDYIIKFDGVGEDKKSTDYTKVEYIYMKAAQRCGLNVAEVELICDREYHHLLVKRFDRKKGCKLHMHSLCGLTHTNFNVPGIYSYENYLRVVASLTNNKNFVEMAFVHMLFNVISCNQDDHTKNFSFLMDNNGEWSISPLYDITYNKGNDYTSKHQMSINGKRDNFEFEDIYEVAKKFKIVSQKDLKELISFIYNTFAQTVIELGKEHNVNDEKIKRILNNSRKLSI